MLLGPWSLGPWSLVPGTLSLKMSFGFKILTGLRLQFSCIFDWCFYDFVWRWGSILENLARWWVPEHLLGHPGVPWGSREPPTWVQGAKREFVGPPRSPKMKLLLASIFDVFLDKKCNIPHSLPKLCKISPNFKLFLSIEITVGADHINSILWQGIVWKQLLQIKETMVLSMSLINRRLIAD